MTHTSSSTCYLYYVFVINFYHSLFYFAFSSLQFSHSGMSDSLWPMNFSTPGFPVNHQVLQLAHTHVHRVRDAIQPSHPLSSPSPSTFLPLLLLPSIFSASGSFQMSQFFASGGQSIRVSASSSVLPMNIQDWFPLGLTGWISLQSKGLSRVFSNTTVQKHKFFNAQLSL